MYDHIETIYAKAEPGTGRPSPALNQLNRTDRMRPIEEEKDLELADIVMEENKHEMLDKFEQSEE